MKKILILTIILGAFLRYYNVNWDSYKAFHPDERNISWAVTRIKFFNQMNPKFFAYGGLPIYLYRALGEGIAAVTHNQNWLTDWGHIAVIGRSVSATLSTISIFLIYMVGAVYFSPGVGTLAAVFLTFSPWAIREAHFETTETMLVFYLLLLLLIAKKLLQKLNRRSVLLLGLVWGLAMAAKTTSLLFGIIPLSAIWFPHKLLKHFWKKILFSILLGPTAAVIFCIFSPYMILDMSHFLESMTYESGVALGRFSVPYTLQFLHTTPYIYQIETMIWQSGPVILIGLIGFMVMIIQLFQKKNHAKISRIMLFIFPLIYFGWVGSWLAKFNRYNVPFLPFATLAAAWLCMLFIKHFRRSGIVLTTILCCITISWGLANWTVYLRPQTRFTATEWIFSHIPANAKIYTEHWNDGLPLDLPHEVPYNRELLTIYDQDNDAKKSYYADKLISGDFIILSTRRMWATMPYLGDKYPLTKIFYDRLLNGSLGYNMVAVFTSYPQLFGIKINDDTAEESIQVFDHPTVLIFRNVARLSRQQYIQILSEPVTN